MGGLFDIAASEPVNTLPVAEIFGPTVQGEGPYAGRLARFVRFGGCNLSCIWCDTPYTWDGARFDLRNEINAMSVDAILEALALDGEIVVLTGGEPMLYAALPAFARLLQRLGESGSAIHVESNGTLVPSQSVVDLVDVFVLSPKLSHAHTGGFALQNAWADIGTRAEVHLKIVCIDRSDVRTASVLAASMNWPADRTWVMPLGTTARELAVRWPEILDAAIEYGVNTTHRLHVLAWGDTRGR